MRRSTMRPKPPTDHRSEPGYAEWHAPGFGYCAVCSQPGPLERHHVILEQHVRAIDPSKVWDLANALELTRYCPCHREHHSSTARRLPVSALSEENLAFAVELLGEERAADYLVRHYRVG